MLMDENILHMYFYDSEMVSAIFCDFVCWSSSLSTDERRWLDHTGQLYPRMPPQQVQVVEDRRTLANITSPIDNVSLPME